MDIAVHFLQPTELAGAVAWNSGLVLLPRMLGGFADTFSALGYLALAVLPLAMLLKHVVSGEQRELDPATIASYVTEKL